MHIKKLDLPYLKHDNKMCTVLALPLELSVCIMKPSPFTTLSTVYNNYELIELEVLISLFTINFMISM